MKKNTLSNFFFSKSYTELTKDEKIFIDRDIERLNPSETYEIKRMTQGEIEASIIKNKTNKSFSVSSWHHDVCDSLSSQTVWIGLPNVMGNPSESQNCEDFNHYYVHFPETDEEKTFKTFNDLLEWLKDLK